MRLAVVSDIHGNLPALEAVLSEIGRERVDRVVNLGDIVSGPLWPRETAARLRGLDWPTIRGNHERQVLGERSAMSAPDAYAADRLNEAHRRWLAALPAGLRLAAGSHGHAAGARRAPSRRRPVASRSVRKRLVGGPVPALGDRITKRDAAYWEVPLSAAGEQEPDGRIARRRELVGPSPEPPVPP